MCIMQIYMYMSVYTLTHTDTYTHIPHTVLSISFPEGA